MLSARFLLLIVLLELFPAAALGQYPFQIEPVPSDPLELATGPIQKLDTQEGLDAVNKLWLRASKNCRLEDVGRGYDLKFSFDFYSDGGNQFDSSWEVEDTFVPGLGLRWTATDGAGYVTTRLDTKEHHYAEGTDGDIPFALHEAREALLHSMMNLKRDARIAPASLNDVQLTCVLNSNSTFVFLGHPQPHHGPHPQMPRFRTSALEKQEGQPLSELTEGRLWEDTEDCIGSESGLLQVHSPVPGLYVLYDYDNALKFHDHVFPGKVTVTEAGKPIIELRVDSLEEYSNPDPSLFVPTESMISNGPAIETAYFGSFPAPLISPAGAAKQCSDTLWFLAFLRLPASLWVRTRCSLPIREVKTR